MMIWSIDAYMRHPALMLYVMKCVQKLACVFGMMETYFYLVFTTFKTVVVLSIEFSSPKNCILTELSFHEGSFCLTFVARNSYKFYIDSFSSGVLDCEYAAMESETKGGRCLENGEEVIDSVSFSAVSTAILNIYAMAGDIKWSHLGLVMHECINDGWDNGKHQTGDKPLSETYFNHILQT